MRALPLFLVVTLAACSGEPAKPKRTVQQRQEAAEAKLAVAPAPRIYRYGEGELRVFEVPVKDSTGFVDVQRCFVWRDAEFKTSTMSCGQQPEVLLDSK